MTFFLDANVLIYAATGGSIYRDSCLEILSAVIDGRANGRASTSVLEEVWHVELRGRDSELQGHTADLYPLLAPLLPVNDLAFRIALSLDGSGLGSNDRVHVGTCLAQGIDVIATADSGFDRVPGLRRVDPLDDRARRKLLRNELH